MNIPIVATSHLRRTVEKSENKKSNLMNLKEMGLFDEDIDIGQCKITCVTL